MPWKRWSPASTRSAHNRSSFSVLLEEERVGWQVEVLLEPNTTHEFKFMVDGDWYASPDYPAVPNAFGTTNNVIFLS